MTLFKDAIYSDEDAIWIQSDEQTTGLANRFFVYSSPGVCLSTKFVQTGFSWTVRRDKIRPASELEISFLNKMLTKQKKDKSMDFSQSDINNHFEVDRFDKYTGTI
jgi:hypothetical protein